MAWVESYLGERKQVVKINNVKSNARANELGVPQGSIIGPLLFIIYINDLKSSLKWCKIIMFADDTLIYISVKNLEEGVEKMNYDLNNLYAKINQNQLKLNVEKTKLMLVTNKKIVDKNNLEIKINDTVLNYDDETKYLGVIIDSKLNMKANIEQIAKKVGQKIGVLSRTGQKLNFQQKVMVYKTIIEPHFHYCASILFLSSDSDINRLQKLQNKCMRNILMVDRFTSSSDLLKITEFRNVKQIIICNTLIFLYKIINM